MRDRFCMTCPMAKSQIAISKTPRKGARYFLPWATKMVRRVPSVTTTASAKNTSTGKKGDSTKFAGNCTTSTALLR